MRSTTSANTGKEASRLGRRVVVTGIGLICAVGTTTEEVRNNLLAGKSGVTRITQFDSTNYACQIAAEVKNFDPLNFVEKKELKKMARFIHLALAASEEAMKCSGLKISPENEERVGVHIGSGIGGVGGIEADYGHFNNGGLCMCFSVLNPSFSIYYSAG